MSNKAPSIKEFQKIILDHYRKSGRPFPWREVHTPYNVIVSEIMLQQTQTERVMQKFIPFIEEFPTFTALAEAPLQKVLLLWQGLGYNRRALALKKCAEIVVSEYQEKLPEDFDALLALPGIGKATAASIQAFAFNTPSVFIETNIRRVIIHFFFHDEEGIHDTRIMPLVEQTLWRENPRDWYYALMDYGVALKKEGPNPNRRSAHYVKQSKFVGSRRQVRGMIVKLLTETGEIDLQEASRKLEGTSHELVPILTELRNEGFLTLTGSTIKIAQ